MLLDRLRVTKSRNSLGGWDGILRLAIRGEGWLNEAKEWSLECCETISMDHFSPAHQGCPAFRPSVHFVGPPLELCLDLQ
jgi:hypothetical protein